MIVGTNDMKTVSLQSEQLWLKQAKDMTLFRITEQRFSFINATNPEQGIQMSIVLKRKIMAELLTTFFPSILLTLITFATTLFKPIYFEASLSVNLTTMLVMTTIFISKMESLPTSATKMIDIWLILCQLAPFVQVILVTGIEYLGEEEQEEQVKPEEDKEISSEEEQIPEPKEAWDFSQKKKCTAPVLTIIGNIQFLLKEYIVCSLRKEGDAFGGHCYLRRLLWSCC